MDNKTIGQVVGGSIEDGLKIRLAAETESIALGSYLIVESMRNNYLAMVSDIQHPVSPLVSNPMLSDLSTPMNCLIEEELLQGEAAARLELSSPRSGSAAGQFQPVATLPGIHSQVRLANSSDIQHVFGGEGAAGFTIGNTREQNQPVPIDLGRLIKRSLGVYGSSGSGKTFLARVMISGLISSDLASVLLIDAHQEFAYSDVATDSGSRVTGLKDIFGANLRSVGLGAGAKIRSHSADLGLEIGYSDVLVEDILLLDRILDLPPTAPFILGELERRHGKNQWFGKLHEQLFQQDQGEEASNEISLHKSSLKALKIRLSRLYNRPYLVKNPQRNTISEIIHSLQRGESVVVSLAENNPLDYLLVVNILTRRICEVYGQTNDAYRSGSGTKPHPLIIAVEEAHRLLNSTTANQTAFGELAREWRKQSVTLMVIDQRPSVIDSEISSQIGTRFIGLLTDERDIQNALAGLPGKDFLRRLIATLKPSEEMLVAGWGVPIPVVIRTRRFDQDFIRSLGTKTG
jgi:DNA helicase HerA-like ATPase